MDKALWIQENRKYFVSYVRDAEGFLRGDYDFVDDIQKRLWGMTEELFQETNAFFVRPLATYKMEQGGRMLMIVFLEEGEEMTPAEKYAYESITEFGRVEVWVVLGIPPVGVKSIMRFAQGKAGKEKPCDLPTLRGEAKGWHETSQAERLPQEKPQRTKCPPELRYVRNLPKDDVRSTTSFKRWAVGFMFSGCFGYAKSSNKPNYPADVDAGFIANSGFLIIESKRRGKELNDATTITYTAHLRHNDGGLIAVWTDGGNVVQVQTFDGKANCVDPKPKDCTTEEFLGKVREVLHRMCEMEKTNKFYEVCLSEGLHLS